MNETIEELTVNFEDDNGVLVVKELDKAILSKGAWTTILFRYQDWRSADESYGPEKYCIRRYRKVSGSYKCQSKFTISSPDQAKKIIDILKSWIGEK